MMVTCSTLLLSTYGKKCYVIIKTILCVCYCAFHIIMIVEINYDLNRFYRLIEWEIWKLTVDSLPLFKNVDDGKIKAIDNSTVSITIETVEEKGNSFPFSSG